MPLAKSRLLRPVRVTPIRSPDHIALGRAALSRGSWRKARRAFQSALARAETPEAMEGLGLAAWWLDAAALVFKSRERAYQLYRQRGDRSAAARIAVWLAWDSAAFRGEAHVANGWLQRARRLLEDSPNDPERAWLAVREGIFALLGTSDADRALACATEAIRVARAAGKDDYEAIGGALRGLALVTSGNLTEGMQQLDEVNAAVLAGEVRDPVAIALAGCYLVSACERVRDSQRATQWCQRLKSFCTTWGLRPLLGVCRTQYASVCVWRGDWAEAEKELLKATDELIASRPALSGEGHARLGELRRKQGRLADAERLFERAGHHPLAMIGLGAVAFDRGDAKRAAALADRYLRRTPLHARTERAAGLELLARASIERGAVDAARSGAAELADIARATPTPSLRASSAATEGRLAAADGRDDDARRCFEDAIDEYETSGAPFEAAQIHLALATICERLGQRDDALESVRSAIKTMTSLRADGELTRARALEQRLQSPARPVVTSRRSSGLSARELDVVRLIAKGLSNAQIAKRLAISTHTVHRHVANVLVKLDARSRSAIVARTAALGLLGTD